MYQILHCFDLIASLFKNSLQFTVNCKPCYNYGMKTNTAFKIREFIAHNKQSTAKQIEDHFLISRQAVHRQLRKLEQSHLIERIGTAPKVYYYIPDTEVVDSQIQFPAQTAEFIQENYLYISPLGAVRPGVEGFLEWCESRGQNPKKAAEDYVKTLKKYQQYRKRGLIDGLPKAKDTFDELFLNQLFYLDFYSIERFGKTELGQLLLYAKQSQNKRFIRDLGLQIKSKIQQLVETFKVDAVCFVPPTVKRQVQLMTELEKQLRLDLPSVSIVKVSNAIAIPQKTLSKLADRVENARRTIVVDESRCFKKVLLIDDAVGSGATLNETAKQLKEKGVATQVIGLALVGSFKGFEVISEV